MKATGFLVLALLLALASAHECATKPPAVRTTKGNTVTVLSIDGGGIRGIIPGTILAFLESKLQVFPLLPPHGCSTNLCSVL